MFAILPCIHLENYTGKTLKTKYRHAVNTNGANDSNVEPRKIGSLFKFTPKRILHQNISMEYVRDFHLFIHSSIHLPYCNLEWSTTREINRKQHGCTCSSWSWINRTDSNPIARCSRKCIENDRGVCDGDMMSSRTRGKEILLLTLHSRTESRARLELRRPLRMSRGVSVLSRKNASSWQNLIAVWQSDYSGTLHRRWN